MKKKSSSIDDDIIDLTIIFKYIWDGKIKIFIITLISIFLGYGYYNQIPDSFKSSLVIKQNFKSEFLKFNNVMQLINNDDNLNSEFLKRFIEIAQDDNQLISVLKDKQIINKKVLKLSDMQQEYEYSNLLNLKKIDDKEYIISFTWHNSKEASEILKKVINLTLSNLKLSFFNELETLLNEKKKKKLDYDNKIISFLSEQRLIAKDLNIINHDLDHIIFLSETFKALTADPNLSSYYLRGVKFLDKQIDIIKSRKYIEFADMEKEINLLKKKKIDFVNYSMETISVKSLKKKFYSVLFKSILLGLIIGIFYVIIFNALQPQIASRK